MKWLARNTAYMDWLTVDRPAGRGYARHQAEKMHQLGIATHFYFVQVGGAVIYDSALAPRSPQLAGDLLSDLIAEDHQRGIKLVACWLGTLPANALQAREHPDWIVRAPDGSPTALVCYNSPLREFVFAQVREVLTAYEVDGIYFDQLMTGCYCAYCQRHYEESYGTPLPFDAETPWRTRYGDVYAGSPDEGKLRAYADQKRVAFLRNVRRSIDALRPDAALIVNQLVGSQARLGVGLVDALLPEVVASRRSDGRADSRDTLEAMLDRSLTETYGQAPAYGEVKYDNFGPRSVPVVHSIVQMAAAVANGNPIIIRDQDALDTDAAPKRRRTATAMRELSLAQQWIADARPVRYAALVHSLASAEARGKSYDVSFYGMHRLLAEHHIPYEVISAADIAREGLAGYRCVILANTEVLSTSALNEVRRFVQDGGGLFVTYRAGMAQPSAADAASRAGAIEDSLAALLGVVRYDTVSHVRESVPLSSDVPVPSQHRSDFFYGQLRDEQSPLLRGLAGVRVDFEAPFVEIAAQPGTEVLADALDFDQRRINADLFCRRMPFPGEVRTPLATLRGKVCYLAAPVERAGAREQCDELNAFLVRAIEHVGGARPFEVRGAPPSVYVSCRRDSAGTRYFLLVNMSSTPTLSGYLRYVVPVHGIELTLPGHDGKSVRVQSLRGSPVVATQDADRLSVKLDRLGEYDVLRVEVCGG